MNELPSRPNPDDLLRRINEEEARARRGRLKVFFGFAPGVGKTFRMLQVARDLVADQGLDVVIGCVETHRRRETAAMMLGLELLPRRRIEYRGHVIEEFNLEAALARRPKLVLVDELAHSNAPGATHRKRWQDVLELLDAGIDVYTTVNVQHLESLNDVIAQITHVQVRETVPDSVIDDADSVELVDIAPEELLQRLNDGKVYLPEQALHAVDHFFKRGNLLALRELALRRITQHVDHDVLAFRAAHGLSEVVPSSERVLVCVGPAPSSGNLVRAAARLAAGLRCPWVAVYVEPTAVAKTKDEDRERLEAHLRLAESLGATVSRLTGTRISEALLAYARRHNVTRIVIGKPTHSRLRDRLRGSLLDEVVRGSGGIDLQVISGSGGTITPTNTANVNTEESRSESSLRRYVAALALVIATLGVALLMHRGLALPDPEMLFMLTVMVTAVRFGRGPSVLAAAASIGAYDFFFVPPYYTLNVADRRFVLTFVTMFAVGFVLGELASRLRRQEQEALAREERTGVLYALSRELSAADESATIAAIAVRHAAELFESPCVVLCTGPNGELAPIGAHPMDTSLDAKEMVVAKWALDHSRLAGRGTDTLSGSSTICSPLHVGSTVLGVLVLVPRWRGALRTEQRAFLDIFCRQIAAALERVRLAEESRVAAMRARAEEMRSSLLSAVSHDLRTPLASITGAATTLRDDAYLDPATSAELLATICDEAERLERLVSNLLDMTRLESGALSLKRDWIPLEEMIGSALTRIEGRLAKRKVSVEIAKDVPLIRVDPVLFEQVFVNLFENACKYTPETSSIDISASRKQLAVAIEVRDDGPGVPEGSEGRIFEKFYRSSHFGVAGAGLGLAICRGIVEAHGGVIRAEAARGGGLCFEIMVPIGGEPPAIEASEASR
jgi:two-component system sensor histidine kinase KdpD